MTNAERLERIEESQRRIAAKLEATMTAIRILAHLIGDRAPIAASALEQAEEVLAVQLTDAGRDHEYMRLVIHELAALRTEISSLNH